MLLSADTEPGIKQENRKSNEEIKTKNPLHDRGGGNGIFNTDKQ